MSTIPPNLSGGAPAPTHADFAALRKFAIENALTSGAPGMRRRAFGGGSLMTPIPQRVRRPIGKEPSPFTPIDRTDGSTLKVGFVVGRVNNVVPTLGGVALDDDTPPAQTITETTYFYLKCTGTFGTTDTYEVIIDSNTTGDTPVSSITGTGFISYLPLALASVDSGDIEFLSAYVDSNMGVESYGSINLWWEL